ncbi:Sulfite reductase [ferredoxin] [Polystyrenella longa]|uniref:Sulfite reductase [ferredoxin] n=1 Tax=Polystyrenella longa TaxID=2528007 RepID=A0A518CST0_9PLAN|nr:NADPH-dependent assimilatory sulfite reductase hemoprotein subunit [Polystyrenella longa]QDU82234.1 Sulfite reductase [ferredoxin] [Polystyrenella longa]
MSEEVKLSKLEQLKLDSRQLRGTIAEELANDELAFSADASQLLKHHGSYQQDNRDERNKKLPDGTKQGKVYSMMLRTRMPGGKVTAKQFLTELDLCDQYGNGTLRVTTRQAFQLHEIPKKHMKTVVRAINDSELSTISACGDVNRNVIACPAPFKNNSLFDDMQKMADQLADHFRPHSTAYCEIWLEDDEGGKTKIEEFKPVEEPIYGERYLPRKFKMGVALPDDNCIDLHANDLGFLAIVEDEKIVGYNLLAGGGMGTTPSLKGKTFPALAVPLCYATVDETIAVAEAVVKVQRDFGNREDRKIARMKYVIADWGIEKFREKVGEYYGKELTLPLDVFVTDADDHIGWYEQGDGKWFLGVNIENGRIQDEGDLRIKTGLRTILEKYRMDVRLTALQAVLLCNIEEQDKADIEQTLRDHGIKMAEELSLLRRYSIACPALPTCGLAVTESERILPALIDSLEAELERVGLADEKIALHMTGCPNGCARPYHPDIGLVGKAKGKYTLFLGGNVIGTRLAFIYKDMVPLEEIVPLCVPLFEYYAKDRTGAESFGDFCNRKGAEDLEAYAEKAMAS